MKTTNSTLEHRGEHPPRLPIEVKRRFHIHLYWVSHGVLLLRSPKSNTEGTRVDILFQDVAWMALPSWLCGLEIAQSDGIGQPFQLPKSLREEAALRKTYRVTTEGTDHFIIAGGISISEDRGNCFDDSTLLPDLRVTTTFPS